MQKLNFNPALLMQALVHQIDSLQNSSQRFGNMKAISTSRSYKEKTSPNFESRKMIRKRRNKAQHKLGRRNNRH